MMSRLMLFLLTLGAALHAAAIPIPDDLDGELRTLIRQHNLTGDPNAGLDIPDVDSPEVKLGKRLFFSKALSGNKDVACASCHHPYLGGGDGLSLPVGTLAEDNDVVGPGRRTLTGEFYIPRNSPTIFNAGLYKRSLFRDARVEFLDWLDPEQGISTPDVAFGDPDPKAGDTLLAAQARFPPVTDAEMRGFDFMTGQPNQAVRAHLAARIGDYGQGQGELLNNQWRPLFTAAYGEHDDAKELITFANITRALSAYQASMNFTDNPWNRYVKGDLAALTESQKRGAYLYLYMPPPPSDGGTEPDFLPTQCIGCHNTDNFAQTKESNYHRLAFPQIGPGTGSAGIETQDLGRMHRNGERDDIYSFRSGTLLNIEVTGPFGHAGNYDTLEQVIDHYDDYHALLDQYINHQGWCEQPQFQDRQDCYSLFPDTRDNTDLAAVIIDDEIADGAPVLKKLNLSRQSKTDLVEFLKALTDPCVKQADCLQAWLPQPEDTDPDGLQLHPKNGQGVPLYLTQDCTEGDGLASGAALTRDQGQCVSGQAHYLYFDVAQDNTRVYLSSRGGQGALTLYYHPETWATERNATARSIGEATQQVLVITLNQGRHFVSAIGQHGYQGVSLAYGHHSAHQRPEYPPRAIADQCQAPSLERVPVLPPARPVCMTDGDHYYFVPIDQPNARLEIRTQHGQGNTDVFVDTGWPSRDRYTFSSRNEGNDEYLSIDSPPLGGLFILAAADEHTHGASIQVDITPR
ncbi:cytochrome c peroxidase [Vibrio ostreicida]|nr:cytochrome c peroxidase [Vibrio ostreicida]NPD09265.1 cytochrome C peroxidase [Vibrio ostreicida]